MLINKDLSHFPIKTQLMQIMKAKQDLRFDKAVVNLNCGTLPLIYILLHGYVQSVNLALMSYLERTYNVYVDYCSR